MLVSRLGTLFIAGALLLGACDGGGYRVVLVSASAPEELGRAQLVEISLVPSCEGRFAGDPLDAVRTIVVGHGGTGAALGAVPPGDYGLYARSFFGCRVTAAGCTAVHLDAGGEGTFTVDLGVADRVDCPISTECDVTGHCAAFDAGTDPCGCSPCYGCDPTGTMCMPVPHGRACTFMGGEGTCGGGGVCCTGCWTTDGMCWGTRDDMCGSGGVACRDCRGSDAGVCRDMACAPP